MIKKATFIRSITDIKDAPLESYPEIILMGRSNVGKSTFINALTQRKKLAKTSQTPGKTLTLNYYNINNEFYLIDTPGYGYTKASKTIQQRLLPMIVAFLENSNNLKAIFQLIDFKVGATKEDDSIHQSLLEAKFEVILIFVKKNKVKKTLQQAQLKKLMHHFSHIKHFFLVSSIKQEGMQDLKNFLAFLMKKDTDSN
ncbi:ribosome biogenesis GTP-binding protein YihA/YsxC [Candidatus Phytoplasma solani]|uniref:Probable GTP-binding protein EngB n=1 Tax=Candidatus Phytoplasma solani TaxID=69896 RepID=A0A421NYC7_9MOLU|nr:ribosome biogenesis GTP-binding protein YihA/YsxC [Candidatus Phytoplasma solani]RMI88934.1 ribosome biogenesis GTP-binding protein YsxC [Candidatus Phytoplasma solani]CCP88207.1 GTP-binding protein EngB [Candidatus Phytoplasma solani]CCP88701.1 GTP-binding protein EngB [Candidatus Phytoplasma solani]